MRLGPRPLGATRAHQGAVWSRMLPSGDLFPACGRSAGGLACPRRAPCACGGKSRGPFRLVSWGRPHGSGGAFHRVRSPMHRELDPRDPAAPLENSANYSRQYRQACTSWPPPGVGIKGVSRGKHRSSGRVPCPKGQAATGWACPGTLCVVLLSGPDQLAKERMTKDQRTAL